MTASFVRRVRLMVLFLPIAVVGVLGASALTPPALRGVALREQESMRLGYEEQVAAHQVEVAVREQEVARTMDASWEAMASAVVQSHPTWTPRNLVTGQAEASSHVTRPVVKVPATPRRLAWITLLLAAAFFTWMGLRLSRRQGVEMPFYSKK